MRTHKYLLRRPNACHAKKLTKWDVEDMRRWARTEGLGLPVLAQAKWLHASWPHVSVRTLQEILKNETWIDLSYDREVPLPTAPSIPSFGLLSSLMALLQILCGEPCSPSR